MILWVFPSILEGFPPILERFNIWKITLGSLLFVCVPVQRKFSLVPRALYLFFILIRGRPNGSSTCPQLARTSFLNEAVVADLTQNGNLKVRAVLNVVRLPGRYFRGLFKGLKEDHRSGKEVLPRTSERLYWKTRDSLLGVESGYKCKIQTNSYFKCGINNLSKSLSLFLIMYFFKSACVFEGTRSSAHQQTSSWSWNTCPGGNCLITSVSTDV